jgi:hypothetical protein
MHTLLISQQHNCLQKMAFGCGLLLNHHLAKFILVVILKGV